MEKYVETEAFIYREREGEKCLQSTNNHPAGVPRGYGDMNCGRDSIHGDSNP